MKTCLNKSQVFINSKTNLDSAETFLEADGHYHKTLSV